MRESKLCHGSRILTSTLLPLTNGHIVMAMLGINMLTRRASFQFFLSWAHIFGINQYYPLNLGLEDYSLAIPIDSKVHTAL